MDHALAFNSKCGRISAEDRGEAAFLPDFYQHAGAGSYTGP
jgi:hypothetical protein